MHIVVIADGEDQKAFQDKELPEGVIVQFFTSLEEARKDADAYFYLSTIHDREKDLRFADQINSPLLIKEELVSKEHLPASAIVLKGWPGTLFDETIELEVSGSDRHDLSKIFQTLGWKYKQSAH